MSTTPRGERRSSRERSSSIARSAIKQGYMFKRPLKKSQKKNLVYRMKPWKSRWFVLQKTCLYYFDSAVETEPLGSIPLDSVNIQMKESKNKRSDKFKFALVTPYATHIVAARTEKERSEWIEVIMSTCGANKLATSIDYVTKVMVTVVEAKFEDSSGEKMSSRQPNTECFVSVNTPFQQFTTVKKFKTMTPIFNEQFVFDCPRFPVEFYVFMQMDSFQDTVFNGTSEEQLETVSRRKFIRSDTRSGMMRMTLMQPQVNINSGSGGSNNPSSYHVERTGDFDLQMEGWFKIKRKEDDLKTNTRSFVVVDDDEVQRSTTVLGEVFLRMEYAFEDLSGFPISIDNLLYGNKEDGTRDRRKMLSRRYKQELERVAMERNNEVASRIENNSKNKLAELKNKLAEEENNFKMSVQKMKEKEEREKRELEERLQLEEQERMSKLQRDLEKQERERKRLAQEIAAKEALEDEQKRIAMLLEMKKEKEEKLKDIEDEAQKKQEELKREMDERIRREEEELRQRFEDALRTEQEERLMELDFQLRKEEEYKKKQLRRDIKNLETEMAKTKEYMEMQELRKKNLDSELKKEEKKRMRDLQKQIKKEELEMLKTLQKKIESEEVQRIKELEKEIDKIEFEQANEVAAKFNEEVAVRIEQITGVPPPPPTAPSVSAVWFGNNDEEEEGSKQALIDEMKFGAVRLRKVEVNAHKRASISIKPKALGLTSTLQETLLRRRQFVDSDEERGDSDDDDLKADYSGSTDSSNLLSIIAKKIAKIEKESKLANNSDDDELFGSDSDDDW